MGKTTFSFFLFLVSVSAVFAQHKSARKLITSHYNQQQLSSLQHEYKLRAKKGKQAAYRFAKAKGIPTLIEKPNGGISVLQRVTEKGTLIYYTTNNAGAAETTRTTTLYDGGSLGLNIEGQGMVMMLWDGGAVLGSHELLKGRVAQLDDAKDYSSHATHVAGTLIGAAEPQKGAARGMAFKATLNAYDFDDDLAEMTAEAADGLLISNHSYGFDAAELPTSFFGRYDEKARAVDQIAASAPNYLMVVSAGNSRNADEDYNADDKGYDLLSDMGVAKNTLTVAAVHQVSQYTGPESVRIANFSSFGPTDDGRIKPDLSGKGVNVFSSIASSEDSYAYYSGTSMASPNVSGSLLLLQQLHHNLYGTYLKAATLKAVSIHTALETGFSDGPDYRYGWGLLNMEGAAKIILDEGFTTTFEELSLNDGDTYTEEINAVGEEIPLKITVVWTDPAGPLQPEDTEDENTPRLVNDLDVRLEDGEGNVTYPWRLDGKNYTSAATRGDNILDNVEKIELPNAVGKYTVSVGHKGELEHGKQDYSIIISGISKADFSFTPDKISKKYCSSEEAVYEFKFLTDENYDSPVEFSIEGIPAELETRFSEITDEDTFTLTIADLETVEPGEYSFTVTAENENHSLSKELKLKILDGSIPPAVSLKSPEPGARSVFVFPTLRWEKVSSANSYLLEISEDEDFESIFLSRETEELSMEIPGLSPEITYYWRVRARNDCAEGVFSTRKFTTEKLYCADAVFSEDTPVDISIRRRNTREANLTIPEEDSTRIGNIKVTLKMTHSNLGDLKIYLTSPAGTQVMLLDNSCGERQDMDVVFDDAAIDFACNSDEATTLTGSIKPQQPLNNLIGEDSAGMWTLKVVDGISGNGGSIDSFGLTICGGEDFSVDSKDSQQFALFPNPAKNRVNIQLKETVKEAVINVYDLNGRFVLSKRMPQENNRRSLNISALQAGMYFVEVVADGRRAAKKLIIH